MKSRKITSKGFVSDSGQLMLPRSVMQGVAAQFSGRDIFITFEDAASIRTPNQNGYYWAGIIEPITERFNELGERFDADTVHEILKYKFLRVIIPNEETGEVLAEYVRSTASLKTYEFAFYLEDCIRYAAESLELVIEPPRVRRYDYIFPIFPGKKETREKYIGRIREYVDDIFDIAHLVRYFNQNQEWEFDPEIKAVFAERKEYLKRLRAA